MENYLFEEAKTNESLAGLNEEHAKNLLEFFDQIQVKVHSFTFASL